ncbi:uncharacterized protein DMAD_10448 [Drosophila madeirensis]|uniref:DNA/RNA non-specific endonuclease/pyrophosphatase/phosphodiesterase domain-containing protein n=1 Tax=Drosophila madeirensis TaxID=30013 RepID=A0AAU9F9M2_DROMD
MPQNELIFARGHLAPVGDFVFEKDIRLTSKYINVVAQFASINNGNWKIIENWVRRQLTSRTFDVLKVCTGALHVLQLSDTRGNWKDTSLLAPNKNPIPKWMYKIVSHISEAHFVFLTYNNVRPTPESGTQICMYVCVYVGSGCASHNNLR